jgi:hypothetical protein
VSATTPSGVDPVSRGGAAVTSGRVTTSASSEVDLPGSAGAAAAVLPAVPARGNSKFAFVSDSRPGRAAADPQITDIMMDWVRGLQFYRKPPETSDVGLR